MKELIIDPKFRDLIPKLTSAEFEQLEKNIVSDGCIKSPIITWKGVIIDGHHRYYVAQKHSEIPYSVEEKDFRNEYEAMSWACNNQLGRRNLTNEQKTYLIGKRLENEKMAYGAHDGFRGNRYKKGEDLVRYQNGNLLESEPEPPKGRTAERLAKEYGIGRNTVNRAEQFAKGVDIADEISPGTKDKILSGELRVPKSIIQQLPKAEPEQQKTITDAVIKGDIETVKTISKPLEEKRIDEGCFKCTSCGKILPLSEKIKGTRQCRQCRYMFNAASKAYGGLQSVPDDIKKLSNEQIVNSVHGACDTDSYGIDDFEQEVSVLVADFERNMRFMLDEHGYLLKENEASKRAVLHHLNQLRKDIVGWGETYNYDMTKGD